MRRIRRILVPLDGPSAVGENLELLREISQALRSEVILLHVGSPEPEAAELRQLPSGAGGPDDPEAQFQLMHQVWNFLKDSIAVSDVRLNLIQQVWTFLKREIATRTVMTKGSLVEETLSHERSMDADLVAVARQHGLRRIEVTGNPNARRFYEREGFVVVGEVPTRFRPGLRMRLDV